MDPDPGGPKTYGSDGSGSATLESSLSSVVDPDPHSFCCPGSGSVLGMRIRIREHRNWPKFTNCAAHIGMDGIRIEKEPRQETNV
jgi:hypothetical protein